MNRRLARVGRAALQALCPHSLTCFETRREGRVTRIFVTECRWCGQTRYMLGDRWVTKAEFDAWWRRSVAIELRYPRQVVRLES